MAALSAMIGLLVLAGWWLDIDALKHIAPGLISMKPNAAACFALAGASLWTVQGNQRSRRIAIGLSAAVMVIGGLTIFEYVTGLNLGIDEVLARDRRNSIGMLVPGRMHPMTAFDFVLLAAALAMLARDRWYRVAHTLALVAALVAASALVGYLNGVRQFVGLATFNQMAVHTAVGMIMLATGALFARPDRGLMAAITSDTAGGLMARRLLPVALVVPVILNVLTLCANDAGLFDARFGAAVQVILFGTVIFTFILRAAQLLQRIDLERRCASDQLRLAHDDLMARIAAQRRTEDELRIAKEELEHRVRERTAELASANHDLQRQAAERLKGEQDLRRGELRYRSLVDATTAIVWNTPASGQFESEQPGWSHFTGQSFDQLKGWGWLGAIHPDDQQQTAHVWSEAVANRALYQVTHRIRRGDGEYRLMLVRAVPIVSDDGTIHEWIGVHTDIEEQNQAREALRRGKEAAEAATRAKSEFLANMSHEIRTPMNGILGMTELALETDLTAQQREYLGLVKSSADSLLTVINDILDFSKIEAGKLDLDPIPFGLRDCVEGTLKILAVRAHGKGLELSGRIAPDVPDGVVGDSGRLQQVLVNLVGNAIKFTERGEVSVAVEACPDGPDGETLTLHLSVTDTGIGIPVEKRQAILEPFTQADGSTTRKYGGTGLGLAISCKLIELMGGRLWIDSEPGHGSTFHFTAQLRQQTGTPPTRAAGGPERMHGLPVLIVDDNRTNRRILDEVITSWGATPTSVSSGPAALKALAAAQTEGRPFRVVLLDVMMPGMDGYAVAERIAAQPGLADTLVVLLTSNDCADDSQRRQALRIAAKLTKPIRQSDLLELLIDLLTKEPNLAPGGERRHPSSASTAEPGAADGTPPKTPLKILVADDQVVNQKVVKNFLEKQGHFVTIANNGRQALEILARAPFDLVLMDVQMPEMDGFEAVAATRLLERSTGLHMPMVALTAHAMKGDKERCLDAGFDSYLSKPIRSKQLFQVIDELAAANVDARAMPSTVSSDRVFDRAAALEFCGGEESLLREVLDMFLDDAPRLLAEMHTALSDDDCLALERAAHTLRGAAANFAATEVETAALRIELEARSGARAVASAQLASLECALERFVASVGELADSRSTAATLTSANEF